jgi:hypothetical protein
MCPTLAETDIECATQADLYADAFKGWMTRNTTNTLMEIIYLKLNRHGRFVNCSHHYVTAVYSSQNVIILASVGANTKAVKYFVAFCSGKRAYDYCIKWIQVQKMYRLRRQLITYLS